MAGKCTILYVQNRKDSAQYMYMHLYCPFLADLKESSGRGIVVTLGSAFVSASASRLDVLVKVFLKTHISLTLEGILLILALWLDIGPNFTIRILLGNL